jgi:DNA-binding transcriptional LysR family regulator
MRVEVLLTEPRWVALHATHPLAAYLTAIANGYGVALVPESAARYYARPGITYRPVTGVSPSQVAVAWPPANNTNPVVQDFVRCCLESRTSTAEPA